MERAKNSRSNNRPSADKRRKNKSSGRKSSFGKPSADTSNNPSSAKASAGNAGKKKSGGNRGGNNRSKKQMVSKIDPKTLVKKAIKTEVKKYETDTLFSDFDLHPTLLANIEAKGYKHPTEIQDKSLANLLEEKNMIGIAATGTGKTGAFLIPMVDKMIDRKNPLALVVVPTRELALQVEMEFRSLIKGTPLRSVSFIGGTNINADIRKARQKHHLIVATPGRLNDLVSRKVLNLNNVSTLVLDEFDRMLDMGFINDIKRILSYVYNRKQTLLFSATVEPSQKHIIEEIVHNPVKVSVNSGTKSSDNVDQDVIYVHSADEKFNKLLDILKSEECEKTILFVETKRKADRITKKLNKHIKSDTIHGDKSQNYRVKAIKRFKEGDVKVLVATDVAARGIDIDGITHVINFQLPLTMDSYIHRIGRTGRAGNTGQAFTFVDKF